MNASARLSLSLSLALALAACGGGGGGTDTGTDKPIETVTIPATLTFGGGCAEVRQSGTVVQPPFPLYCTDYGVEAGRVFFNFFVGAGEVREVVSAKLRLVPQVIDGDPTQGFTNGFRAERVNIQGPYDGFDYDLAALGAPSPMGPVQGESLASFELDVTDALRNYVANNGGSNFFYLRVRLDHLIAGNQTPIGIQFHLDANTPPAFMPTLIAQMR